MVECKMDEVQKAYDVTGNPHLYTASEVKEAWETREILDEIERKYNEVKTLAVVVAQNMIADFERGRNERVFETLELAKNMEDSNTPKNKGLVDEVGKIFWAHVNK